jgi:hypothetical protein
MLGYAVNCATSAGAMDSLQRRAEGIWQALVHPERVYTTHCLRKRRSVLSMELVAGCSMAGELALLAGTTFRQLLAGD